MTGSRRQVARAALAGFLALAAPVLVLAQASVQVAVAPSRAAVGDTVSLSVSVTGAARQVSHPTLQLPQGLRLLQREPSISQQYSVVNGQMSQSVEFTYAVACVAEGALVVPGPRVSVDGAVVTGNDVSVTVIGAGAPGPTAGTGAPSAAGAIRLEASLLPERAVAGQAVGVVVRLYVPRAMIGDGRWGWVERPGGEGLLLEQVGDPGREWALVSVGSVPTMVCEVGRFAATPTRAGTYRVRPGSLKVVVRAPRRRSGRSLFDSFFEDDDFFGVARGQEVLVSGEPLTLEVTELPSAGRPAGFKGTCGAGVQVTAGVTRTELKENESLTYKVVVEGRGDLRTLELPKLELGDAFRVFEAKTHPALSLDESGVRTRKGFEYVLVPTRAGQLTLPALGVDYFDTAAGRYLRAESPSSSVRVLPGEREEVLAPGALPVSSGRQVTLQGRDIAYIKETRATARPAGAPPLHRRWEGWAAFLAPLLLVLVDWLHRQRGEPTERELRALRSSRAQREARRRVSEARAVMGDGKAFYAGLRAAVVGYLADKLGASPAGFVFAEERGRLQEVRCVPAADLDRLAELLERCEGAAYSPVLPDQATREADAASAEGLLDLLELRLS